MHVLCCGVEPVADQQPRLGRRRPTCRARGDERRRDAWRHRHRTQTDTRAERSTVTRHRAWSSNMPTGPYRLERIQGSPYVQTGLVRQVGASPRSIRSGRREFEETVSGNRRALWTCGAPASARRRRSACGAAAQGERGHRLIILAGGAFQAGRPAQGVQGGVRSPSRAACSPDSLQLDGA